MRAHRLTLVATLLLGTTACGAAMTAGSDYDSRVPIGSPRTFSWDEPDALPTGDPRLDNNPFFVERVHAAVARELALRGIRETGGTPDLLVHHHAAVRTRVEVLEADTRAGYSASPEPSQVYQFEEGTFLVDVALASSKQVVWRGWAKVDIDAGMRDQGEMTKLVDHALFHMFETFPIPMAPVTDDR